MAASTDNSPLWDPYRNPRRTVTVLGRCGICSFELLEGDSVVAVSENGQRSTEYPFNPHSSFKHWTLKDEVYYYPRRTETWWIADDAVGCHAECLDSERSTPPRERFAALSYSYYPLSTEIERRKGWLRRANIITSALHSVLRRYLIPLEICQLIAGHCSLRASAAAVARQFWKDNSAKLTPDHEFDLARPVWALHVEHEGVRYIARLTNELPDDPGPNSLQLLYTPRENKEIDTVYVAQDYLGVLELSFVASSGNDVAPVAGHRPGVWWKRWDTHPSASFEARTDGLKIRSLWMQRSPELSRVTRVTWLDSASNPGFEVPLPLGKLIWWQNSFDGVSHGRMTSFICNAPGAIGYSVLCGGRPYTFRTHTEEDDLSFYDVEARPEWDTAVWLHMTVDKDERIVEVWARDWEEFYWYPALLVQTNKGRSFLLGTPHDPLGRSSYTLVHRAKADGYSRIYFNTALGGVEDFAFESPPPPPLVVQPPLPSRPESPNPEQAGDNDIYFHTSATLEGVVEVVPCRANIVGFGPAIIGLLLRYGDGHRTALGQVRLDKLEPPVGIDATTHDRMGFHFGLSSEGLPNIDCIGFFERGASPTGPDHFCVCWRGTVEWWFSYRQCRVWYEQQSSRPRVHGDK